MIWWLEFRGVLFRSNDNTPSITSSAAMSVDENSAGGTAVGTVLATDADATAPNKTVSYSITGGTGLGLFDIDASTGAVRAEKHTALLHPTKPLVSRLLLANKNGTPLPASHHTLT